MTVHRDLRRMSRDELVAYFDSGGDICELLRDAVRRPDLGPAPKPQRRPDDRDRRSAAPPTRGCHCQRIVSMITFCWETKPDRRVRRLRSRRTFELTPPRSAPRW